MWADSFLHKWPCSTVWCWLMFSHVRRMLQLQREQFKSHDLTEGLTWGEETGSNTCFSSRGLNTRPEMWSLALFVEPTVYIMIWFLKNVLRFLQSKSKWGWLKHTPVVASDIKPSGVSCAAWIDLSPSREQQTDEDVVPAAERRHLVFRQKNKCCRKSLKIKSPAQNHRQKLRRSKLWFRWNRSNKTMVVAVSWTQGADRTSHSGRNTRKIIPLINETRIWAGRGTIAVHWNMNGLMPGEEHLVQVRVGGAGGDEHWGGINWRQVQHKTRENILETAKIKHKPRRELNKKKNKNDRLWQKQWMFDIFLLQCAKILFFFNKVFYTSNVSLNDFRVFCFYLLFFHWSKVVKLETAE